MEEWFYGLKIKLPKITNSGECIMQIRRGFNKLVTKDLL